MNTNLNTNPWRGKTNPRSILTVLLILTACSGNQTNQSDKILADKDNGGIFLPEGFGALVVADNLGYGRHIDIRENGDIYMALRRLNNDKGIVALRDTTGDGKADIIRYFGEYPGTGMEIYKDYLYWGGDTMVMRYKLSPDQLVPDTDPEIVVRGFPVQNQHRDKPFAIDNEGFIYVNVGAPSNACMEQTRTKGSPGMDPCPQLERHAGIWRFRVDELNQTQLDDGYHYATGTRNIIALFWNSRENHLYAVMHGRDQLYQFFPELYDEQMGAELPSEEFLLVRDGSDFGWPYCYYDRLKGKKVLAPEYGGDGEITGRCEGKEDPIMGFPGHTAPNDLLFYTGDMFPERYKNGAFICFHGSWNRAPLEQEGYYVVFVPFEGEFPSGDWEVFANGFAGNEHIKSPGDAKHRPMGLTQGSDGSIYVSDSRQGTIWRIIYTGG